MIKRNGTCTGLGSDLGPWHPTQLVSAKMERWREHVSVGKEQHNAIEGPLLVLHETVENPKQAVGGSERCEL